jgi:hypothetical protein
VDYFKLEGGDNYNLDLQLKLRTNAVLAQEDVNRQTNMVVLRSTITYLRSFCTAAMLLTFSVLFLREKSYLNFVFWSHHAFVIYSQQARADDNKFALKPVLWRVSRLTGTSQFGIGTRVFFTSFNSPQVG